jgi:hypothetical protein
MKHKVQVEFDDFGWRVLSEKAEREGILVEDLLVLAAMYYLAADDPRRVSRRVLKPPRWELRGGETPGQPAAS